MPEFVFSADFSIRFSQPAWRHCFLLRCLPRFESFQVPLRVSCTVQGAPRSWHPDTFGNPVTVAQLAEPHATFTVRAAGSVIQRPYRICDAPSPAFAAETRLTAPTPQMRDMAAGLRARHGQGLDCVLAASSAVGACLVYEPRATDSFTPAAEALRIGRGVCQDYAHVLIGVLRAAGIPARYVCGYIPGEGASHAWAEAFCNGAWHGIDPTHDRLISLGYIKVAHGRDSDDCPMNRGCFRGGGTQTSAVSVSVTEA